MNGIRKQHKAALTFLATLLLTGLGLLLVPTAQAVQPPAAQPTVTNPALPTRSVGSLTIGFDTTVTARRVLADAAGEAVNLLTTAGWEAAHNLNGAPGDVTERLVGVTFGDMVYPMRRAGRAGSVAVFAALPVGLYYITGIPSFLVTIPQTNPMGYGWIYDVRVYPKQTLGNVAPADATTAATSELPVRPALTQTGADFAWFIVAVGTVMFAIVLIANGKRGSSCHPGAKTC